MAALTDLIARYLEGPALLRRAVAGMTREQLLARPVPGRWSTLEVVCHLADFEPIFADRAKRVIAEDRPTLLAADENRFVAALAYHDRDLDEELTIIEQTRRQLARILRTLPPETLQREGVHSQRGPRTLEQLLESAINHIPHHVRFIEDKRRALGLPAPTCQ
ncbi:MAG: DinB family protein [Gemmataceae bacterium]|nr:DinB family protein [Gemmataceae bacterium]MDW8265564.1 DinB family protein [Gemmataceae bacterium]